MITAIQAIILGIIQGITEWLPISSSGHLVIFQHFFNIAPPVIFDITLHMGSLIVIFIVFWKDIITLTKGVLRKEKTHLKFLTYLIIASIPIAIVGFFLNSYIKAIFNDLRTVGLSLLFTSLMLFLSKKAKANKLTLKNTYIIGMFQAIAILPGVSRSGMTISAGLIQGIKKQEVIKFSFLLFIPAIIGAALFELKNIGEITNMTPMIIGTLAAIITGFLSLKILLKIIMVLPCTRNYFISHFSFLNLNTITKQAPKKSRKTSERHDVLPIV